MSKLIPVFLIGFSGSGKSSVAKYIKDNYSYKVIDIDDEISNNFSKSLVEIFSAEGERVFRKYEEDAIKNSIDEGCDIIAPGGGAIAYENSAILMNAGKKIYLHTSNSLIYKRVKDDIGRPLLKEKSRNEIDQMINQRKPIYEKYSDFTIETDNLSIEELAIKVVEYYESINRTGQS